MVKTRCNAAFSKNNETKKVKYPHILKLNALLQL